MASSSPEQIDKFIAQLFGHQHDNTVFASALRSMEEADVPSINVSASEGMILHVLAKSLGAKRILEIGSLGGYSGLWLASALPDDGKFLTLEINPTHAEVAKKTFEIAGLSGKTEVKIGDALDSLQDLIAHSEPEFDIVFIDADKDNYSNYLDYAIRLTRVGGVILSDNTLTHDALDPKGDTGITRFNAKISGVHGLVSAIIPTMRDDIDGLTISFVASK